jgi:hypothetical protein
MGNFRVIQGCPAPTSIAPYIYLLCKWSNATLNSAYRGEDAKAILHAHGKHTQAEIHLELPAISNPAGRSTHELFSDGVAFPGPVGRKLEEWQLGFDVNDGDVATMKLHAKRHGWELFQPYSRGVEFHHLCFKHRPIAKGFDRVQVIRLRTTLPRK